MLYQLELNGIVTTTVDNLRQMVVAYLREHSDTYMPFVASPVASDSPYNSDTAAPDAIDAYIASMPDPNITSLVAWERYLEGLTNGSWGDHVVIAALANMFNVTINVVHARQRACTVATTSPADNEATNCEIDLGLLMQYHFVGLDKADSIHGSPVSVNPDSEPNVGNGSGEQINGNDQATSTIDDEGDEHTRQITGGPLASI